MNSRFPDISYMSGAGNIFSVFDNRLLQLTVDDIRSEIESLCTINGEMTEGVMAINSHASNDFSVEYFNPDGSHGAMCGNGSRCAVLFYVNRFLRNTTNSSSGDVHFTMAGELYHAVYTQFGNNVAVHFPSITTANFHHTLETDKAQIVCSYIDNGSDHTVFMADEIGLDSTNFTSFQLQEFARPIRNHVSFPKGCNVNIVLIDGDTLYLRTYERGVERETGACGTGALATAFTLHTIKQVPYPISLHVQSGDILTIGKNDQGTLYLEGPARFITRDEAYTILQKTKEKSQ